MRFDVQKELSACVRKMGGIVLDDVLKGPSKPSNADFWFPEHQVVAELKCLTENLMAKAEFNQRVSKLYTSWVARGLMPKLRQPKVTLNVADLPPSCARELLDPVKRRLEVNTFKKANAQIKSIRRHLGADSAKGLLLLVNDGDYAFTPEMMCHLLARSMKSQYSGINSVIYFSVNELVTVPPPIGSALFWVDAVLPNRAPVAKQLREQIRSSWMAHYSGLIPNSFVYEMAGKRGGDAMGDMQFLNNELTAGSSRPSRLRRGGG